MNNPFEMPAVEVILFDNEDVIITSGFDIDGGEGSLDI